jgi:hypothetical protein
LTKLLAAPLLIFSDGPDDASPHFLRPPIYLGVHDGDHLPELREVLLLIFLDDRDDALPELPHFQISSDDRACASLELLHFPIFSDDPDDASPQLPRSPLLRDARDGDHADGGDHFRFLPHPHRAACRDADDGDHLFLPLHRWLPFLRRSILRRVAPRAEG